MKREIYSRYFFERNSGKLRVVNRKSKNEFSLNVSRGKMEIEEL